MIILIEFIINLSTNFKLTIMRNKIMKMVLLCCVFCTGAIVAQEIQTGSKAVDSKSAVETVKKEKKNSIAIYSGFPGFTFGYGRKINDRFSVRLSGSWLDHDQYLESRSVEGRRVNIDANLQYQAIDLNVEFLPFKNSSFKLVAGASNISNMSFSAVIEAGAGSTYGDIIITKEQIGDISLDAKWSGIAPYVAMGFGRTVPKYSRIGYGIEMGGHFIGKPEFKFDATKTFLPLVQTEAEKKEFQRYANSFTFLPTIQLHLNYKF